MITEHAIRARLDSTHLDASAAVLAVLDKCEQMRAESANVLGGVGHIFADLFESVIAEALSIKENRS